MVSIGTACMKKRLKRELLTSKVNVFATQGRPAGVITTSDNIHSYVVIWIS